MAQGIQGMMQVDHGEGAAGLGRASLGLRAGAVVNAVGALVSVGLLAGMTVWGYKLAVRDVSGVPVVRALEGPMRVAPEDPGGMRAAYQGLSVNAVAAGNGAQPLPAQVVLAPEPVALDAPLPALDEASLTDAVFRRPEPGGEMAEPLAETVARGAMEPVRVIPASVPGVARSPVPLPRPAGDLVAETAAMAVLASLSPGATVEVDPDTLGPGTRLVQLGAYDDRAAARAAWEKLAEQFGPLWEGKGRVIQAAEAGGRPFYRLRVHGFGDEAEARRFCAVLVAEEATCIPVLIR